MPVVKIEPTKEHSVPYDTTAQKTATLLDEIAVAGNTAELLVDLGAPLNVSEKDAAKEKELLNAVASAKKPSNLKTPSTAFAAAAFLRTYGQQLAMDAASARAAITNKLMEIANCGDARYELKALELLGKHSDIGIFTERSEITVNYKDPDDLEKAIKDRVKRLLNATVVNEVPLAQSLGAEKPSSSLLAELEDIEVIEEDDISL
jgi:hypothetical protein